MWPQTYEPVSNNLWLSALVAALPVFVLLVLLGLMRKPAWIASLAGLAAAAVVARGEYHMPWSMIVSSSAYGAAYGLLPIGWIVFSAILLYRLTVETGKFEIIKDSIGGLTGDQRLQALLIAFAFGGFIEGASGFGAPVAVCAAMLTGLGFSPFFAAGICLLANTSPVAFGSIGIPIVALQAVTRLPMDALSSDIGRICSPVSLFIPMYLVLVMGGMKALRAVAPAVVVSGIAFAGIQFYVSNWIGPYLAAILAALAAIVALVALLRVWKPKDAIQAVPHRHTKGNVILAWTPYGVLVILVLLWGIDGVKALLNQVTVVFAWPGLHELVLRMPPIVPAPSKYPATYTLNILSAAGTATMTSVFLSAIVLRVSPRKLASYIWLTTRQLALPLMTIASVVALAYVMNYSGATATLGLAFAATGVMFPFFSSILGWLGVFLTGSDTSANALFGTLQTVTAGKLGLNPALMAAANSSGGVMGKMISLQSVAVAAAATGMARTDEGRLFRFTLRHSVFMAIVVGLITLFYAYVMPGWVK